jgi:hypothetical protein
LSAAFTPKIITANALLQGDVVYFKRDDGWSRDIDAAEVLEDEAHAQIRLLEALGLAGVVGVVGVYLADVQVGQGGIRPAHFREVFRSRGPSNYPHGKQAVQK